MGMLSEMFFHNGAPTNHTASAPQHKMFKSPSEAKNLQGLKVIVKLSCAIWVSNFAGVSGLSLGRHQLQFLFQSIRSQESNGCTIFLDISVHQAWYQVMLPQSPEVLNSVF